MNALFWPVALFVGISLAVGLYTYRHVKGESINFMVCGRTLSFVVAGTTLTAQSVDGNASLGNATLSYLHGFWSGAAIPIGLALCLWLTGRFLAPVLNGMELLSLPDYYGRRYGRLTELFVSVLTVISFTILLAGNLASLAWILTAISDIPYGLALLLVSVIIVAYTTAGGLFSAVWTSFLQIYLAIAGFVTVAIYLVYRYGWNHLMAAAPAGSLNLTGLLSLEGGAMLNWSSIFALALGNMVALDFMERVFAANSPRTAQKACYMAAWLTLVAGIPISLIGVMGHSFYQTLAEPRMLLPHLASEILPYPLGALILVGIVGASMSTANGALLVTSIVISRNVIERQYLRRSLANEHLLRLMRLLIIPLAILALSLASRYPDPGILLILAFDVVFAGCVVPLVLGIFWKRGNTTGALGAIVSGSVLRLISGYLVPSAWAGLDTLLPPLVSLVVYVGLSLATSQRLETTTRQVLGAN